MIAANKSLLFLLLITSAMPTFAEVATDEPTKKKSVPAINKLPEPLDAIVGNISDFERDGLFKVTGARLGPIGFGNDPALIWTLRANRSMTLRRAEIFLRDFRKVRFYAFGKNSGRPVFTSLLFYSNRISENAIDGDILPKNISIEVWIPLDRLARLKLAGAKADTMILGPSKQRKL